MEEVLSAVKKLKMDKADAVCSICPEFTQYGEPPVAAALQQLFQSICLSEDIPSDWRKGITVPLY